MKIKIITLSSVILAMSACVSHHKETSQNKVENYQFSQTVMSPKDKKLSCKELLLEMNEAEFFHKAAQEDQNIGFGGFISPFKSVHTYRTATKTMENTQARVEYLNQIYNVLSCNGRSGVKNASVESPRETMMEDRIVQRDYPEKVNSERSYSPRPMQHSYNAPQTLEEPTLTLPYDEEVDDNRDDSI